MIKYLPYDDKDAKSIYEYAKHLVGLTFNDVINYNKINEVHESSLAYAYNESIGYKNKGNLGQIIERDYFGYDNNSNSEADFKDAGLELKVTPYKINENGTISAKERLVLSMIDYSEVARHEFEASHFWDKCKLLLLIYYQHDYNLKSNLDFRIDFVSLFTPEGEDREIIRKDYIFIRNKINDGKAHELSEADTFYLGAVTKSSDSSKRTSQPFSTELAKPRAFSYKNSYMTQVLRRIAGKKQEESIVKNRIEDDFEQYVINKINKFKGMSVEELVLHFNIDTSKKPKNLNSMIAFRMLGIKGNNAEEFEKANVVVKTIRIGNNNKIKEHMSFPTFKFKELVKEDWEDSTFGNILRETKFLFIVYKFDDNDVLKLMGCQFWNMPYQVIESEVKPVWEKTKMIISEGVKLEKVGNEIHNNLPKQAESRVCHVRPHGRDGKDVYELPDGRFMAKQCFWLNNSYIYDQINKDLKTTVENGENNQIKKVKVQDSMFLSEIFENFESGGDYNLIFVDNQRIVDDFEINYRNFSTRLTNGLKRAKIHKFSEILDKKSDYIYKINGIGTGAINELKSFIREHVLIYDGGKINEEGLNINPKCNLEYKDGMLICEVFPDLLKDDYYVHMVNDNKEIVEDIYINLDKFSVRTVNALCRININKISSLLKMDYEKIIKIRNLGKKSVDEIVAYVRKHVQIDKKIETNKELPLDEILEEFEVCKDFDNGLFRLAIYKSIIEKKIFNFDEKNKEEIINMVAQSEYVKRWLKDFISKKIDYSELMGYSTIKKSIPPKLVELGMDKIEIDNLVKNETIEEIDGEFRKKKIYLKEWLNTIDDSSRESKILKKRLSGKTLEECSKDFGITRERVRQLETRAYKEKPILREDDYRIIYEEYDLDKNFFMCVFEQNEQVYNYLKQNYKRGNKNQKKLLYDAKINEERKLLIKNYVNKNKIIIDGEYVELNKNDLVKKLAKKHYSNSNGYVEDFYKLYNDFLTENGLNSDKKLKYQNERAFETRLFERDYILAKYGRKFRYYDIASINIKELIKKLGLEKYKNIEISTRKLFLEHSELMNEYGINDEYELHNIMKKTQNIWNLNKYKLNIARMPFLQFGKISREKQAKNILINHSPMTSEKFGEIYEKEYGVLPQTALANVATYISEYYDNGIYRMDQPLLNPKEEKYLNETLKDDFYTIEDVKNIYRDKFGNDKETINARTLKRIGFNVFSNYVIKNKYSSSEQYFKEILLANNTIDLSKLNNEITNLNSFSSVLNELRSSFDLLEYEDKKYIKYEHLNSVIKDIDKIYLKKYVDEILEFSKNKEYFTITQLRKCGLINKLEEYGFGDWFLSGLIRNSNSIKYIKTNNYIFYRGNNKKLKDFIFYVITNFYINNIYDLEKYITYNYGIKISKNKIIELIKDTSLYYDSIMDKIYLNKDEYYKEIEGDNV